MIDRNLFSLVPGNITGLFRSLNGAPMYDILDTLEALTKEKSFYPNPDLHRPALQAGGIFEQAGIWAEVAGLILRFRLSAREAVYGWRTAMALTRCSSRSSVQVRAEVHTGRPMEARWFSTRTSKVSLKSMASPQLVAGRGANGHGYRERLDHGPEE